MEAALKRLLDLEAFRRLDILEIHAAKRRLQGRHNIDEPLRIGLANLDIEDIDASELLEEHPLALHNRLGRQRADIPQPEHRGAIADDSDHIAAGR